MTFRLHGSILRSRLGNCPRRRSSQLFRRGGLQVCNEKAILSHLRDKCHYASAYIYPMMIDFSIVRIRQRAVREVNA